MCEELFGGPSPRGLFDPMGLRVLEQRWWLPVFFRTKGASERGLGGQGG